VSNAQRHLSIEATLISEQLSIPKMHRLVITITLLLTLIACQKNSPVELDLAIPNGDFEQWDANQNLLIWRTNSCPLCVPPFETYIVQKQTDATHGQFAAKFIYNNVYSSIATNKFAISVHPSALTADIKSNIASGDTALLQVDLFLNNALVDSGKWLETTSTANYKKLEIQITQTSPAIDSALITILGGKRESTELFVDNLEFVKR
jgi:hypothetical protein